MSITLTGKNITYLVEDTGSVVVGNERGGFQSFGLGCGISEVDVLAKYPQARRMEPAAFWELSNRLYAQYMLWGK